MVNLNLTELHSSPDRNTGLTTTSTTSVSIDIARLVDVQNAFGPFDLVVS